MKQSSKHFNIVVSLTLIVLAVVSAISVTWSYFTASTTKKGEMQFSDLQVQFAYYQSDDSGFATATEGTTIPLYVAKGETVERNKPFELASTVGGTAIGDIAIFNPSTSCSAYVRFWIDAYILDENDAPIKTNNYGKYFSFNFNSDVALANAGSKRTNNNVIYCYKGVIVGSDTSAKPIGASITLVESAPVTLLGEELQLFMTLEAVQSANNAAEEAFDDAKGYYQTWVKK